MSRLYLQLKQSRLIAFGQVNSLLRLVSFSVPRFKLNRRRIGMAITRRFLMVSLISGLLAACATGPGLIGNPSAPPPDLGLTTTDGILSAALNYLIVENGPGSWVENALWDEYVLTLENLTGDPLVIERVSLIDPRGVFIESEVDPVILEEKTRSLAQQYESIGMSIAIGQAVSAAGVGMIFGPISSVFGVTRKHYEQQEQADIRNEFNRRQFNMVRLQGQQSMTRSAFFPVVPNPQALVIHYRGGNTPGIVEISLERLKGLHVGAEN